MSYLYFRITASLAYCLLLFLISPQWVLRLALVTSFFLSGSFSAFLVVTMLINLLNFPQWVLLGEPKLVSKMLASLKTRP